MKNSSSQEEILSGSELHDLSTRTSPLFKFTELESDGDGDNGSDELVPHDIETADDENSRNKIGLFSGVNMIIGMMIGSGIFASPSGIMKLTESGGASLLIWLLGGCLAYCGALCYAELGTLMEEAGAEQAYLEHIYGKFFSFEYAWFAIFIGRPCGISIILFVFSEYFVRILVSNFSSWDEITASWTLRGVSILCTIIITAINCLSSKAGVALQNISTVLKTIALALLALSGIINFLIGKSGPNTAGLGWGTPSSAIGNYVMALFHSLWAYDGWNNLNFITPELRNPEKTLPRSINIGVPIVLLCYMAVNMTYFLNLSMKEIIETTGIGDLAGRKIFGNAGGIIISILVSISTFGGANSTIYTGGRLSQAAAKHGYLPFSTFFKPSSDRVGTPVRTLIMQGILSIFFTLSGKYESLVTLFSWMVWIFYGLTIAGVIILRYREPEKHKIRQYKVPLFLTFPFLGGCLILIIVPIFTSPYSVLGGLLIAIIAVPAYFILIKEYNITKFFSYTRI